MTLRQCALISLLFALLVLGSGARAQNCSLAGQWTGSYSGDSSGSVAASFTERGTSVSGTVNGYSPVRGTNSDGQVSLGYTGNHGYGSASGAFSGDCSTLSGTWTAVNTKKGWTKAGTFTITGGCGAPTIMFNGTNVAGQTTPVVAGQEIMLTGQAPNEACVLATVSQQWSLPLENGTPTKNAVGGYTATRRSYATASVTPLPTDTTTTSYGPFYFASPGTYTMTYQYTFNINGASGTSPVSTATFSTDGPTGVSLLICGGDIDEYDGADCTGNGPLGKVAINPGPVLQFGGVSGSNVGIAMTASAIAPSGNFTWVQRITGDVITETPTAGGMVQTCYPPEVTAVGVFPGLDTKYTYPIVNRAGTTAYDNPSVGLSNSYTKVSRAFSAMMNLMWTPTAAAECTGNACTIPVPLGYVHWKVSATAKLNEKGTWVPSGNWSASEFVASSSYPTWTSWITYNGFLVCH
jgi:hypothetical protein